jgi:hypothetical protein
MGYYPAHMVRRALVVCAGEWKPPALGAPLTLFIIMGNWCIKMSISEIISVRYVPIKTLGKH